MNRPDKPINKRLHLVRQVVRWLRMTLWRVRLMKKLTVGRNVFFGRNCYLAPPAHLGIGDNVAIGSDFHLESNLTIGSDVLISSRVSIVGNDHRFDDPSLTVFCAGRLPPSSVIIEGDNLIGHGVIIVGNARIGRGAIVGAGSVVSKDLPPNMVCYGVPARPMKSRLKSPNTQTAT